MINLFDKVKEIIAKIIPNTDTSAIKEDARLHEDLGFDSLGLMILSIELEEAFGFRFTSNVAFETVSDVCGYLDCRI